MNAVTRISKMIQLGNSALITKHIQKALNSGNSPLSILIGGLVNGLLTVCRQFNRGDIYLPEVLRASQAMNVGMRALHMFCPKARFCFVMDKEQLSEHGVNIAQALFEQNGLEIQDISAEVLSDTYMVIYFYSIYEILETLQDIAQTLQKQKMSDITEAILGKSGEFMVAYKEIRLSRTLHNNQLGA